MDPPVVYAAVLFKAPVAINAGFADVGLLGFVLMSRYPFLHAPSNNAEAANKYISFFFMSFLVLLEAYCCSKTVDTCWRRLVQVVYALSISGTYVNFGIGIDVITRSKHKQVSSNQSDACILNEVSMAR